MTVVVPYHSFTQFLARYWLTISALLQYIPCLGGGLATTYLACVILYNDPYYLEADQAWILVAIALPLGSTFSYLGALAGIVIKGTTTATTMTTTTAKEQAKETIQKKGLISRMAGFFSDCIGYNAIWFANYSIILALVKTLNDAIDQQEKLLVVMYYVLFVGALVFVGPLIALVTGNFVNVMGCLLGGQKWKDVVEDPESKLGRANQWNINVAKEAGAQSPAYALSNAIISSIVYYGKDDSKRLSEAMTYGWLFLLFGLFFAKSMGVIVGEYKTKLERRSSAGATTSSFSDTTVGDSSWVKFCKSCKLHLLGHYELAAGMLIGPFTWDLVSFPFGEDDDTTLVILGFILLLVGPLMIAALQESSASEAHTQMLYQGTVRLATSRAFVYSGGVLSILFNEGEDPGARYFGLLVLSYALVYCITGPILKMLDGKMKELLQHELEKHQEESSEEENNKLLDINDALTTDSPHQVEEGLEEDGFSDDLSIPQTTIMI